MAHKKRIAVMRGGGGGEYTASLAGGGHVLAQLAVRGYEVHDMLITKDGAWHLDGFPVTPQDLAMRVDVVWNALHGGYGEDGKHQRVLDRFTIPYTGSFAFPSMMATNKRAVKDMFRARGFKTPAYIFVAPGDDVVVSASRAVRSIPPPYIVKPLGSGSSLGVSVAENWSELVGAIEEASAFSPAVIVEEYITGRELSSVAIDGTSAGEVLSAGSVEVVLPAGKRHMDYTAKHSESAGERAGFAHDVPVGIAGELQEAGKVMHALLGLRHYSKIDAVHSKRGLFLLEVNGAPSISPQSPFNASLSMAGLSVDDMLEYVISLALERK